MYEAALIMSGILAGLVMALKVIAPLTKTKVDDKVLEYAEDAEVAVDYAKNALAPAPAPAAPAEPQK